MTAVPIVAFIAATIATWQAPSPRPAAAREWGGPLPSIDVALLRSDGKQAPFAGHALELMSTALLELKP
jgi:hypothetical protein